MVNNTLTSGRSQASIVGREAPDEGSGGGDVALGVTEVDQAASEPLA